MPSHVSWTEKQVGIHLGFEVMTKSTEIGIDWRLDPDLWTLSWESPNLLDHRLGWIAPILFVGVLIHRPLDESDYTDPNFRMMHWMHLEKPLGMSLSLLFAELVAAAVPTWRNRTRAEWSREPCPWLFGPSKRLGFDDRLQIRLCGTIDIDRYRGDTLLRRNAFQLVVNEWIFRSQIPNLMNRWFVRWEINGNRVDCGLSKGLRARFGEKPTSSCFKVLVGQANQEVKQGQIVIPWIPLHLAILHVGVSPLRVTLYSDVYSLYSLAGLDIWYMCNYIITHM